MLLFAVSALEKVAQVPSKIWLNVVIGLLIFFAAVYVVKQAAQVNKIWLTIIVFVVLTLVGFHWIYSRNEPKFLTPIVDKIAPFFPSAGSYEAKQHDGTHP
ncbi:MAG TPA: hypothetical protein VL357_05610 [Rariglobus sp.]|nr:hypothetical protein [Rariglobus sp.]